MLQLLAASSSRSPLCKLALPALHCSALQCSLQWIPSPHQAVIEPLPEFTSSDRPPVYKPVPWELFRAQRYAGDFQGLRNRGAIHEYKV